MTAKTITCKKIVGEVDMYFHSRTTRRKSVEKNLVEWQRRETLIPKRMLLLMYMIDGKGYSWRLDATIYGGNGKASLNCEGGFGYDSIVRKMVRDKEIRINRYESHSNAHGGNPTINRTQAIVTSRGREVYASWKKRMKGRISFDRPAII